MGRGEQKYYINHYASALQSQNVKNVRFPEAWECKKNKTCMSRKDLRRKQWRICVEENDYIAALKNLLFLWWAAERSLYAVPGLFELNPFRFSRVFPLWGHRFEIKI